MLTRTDVSISQMFFVIQLMPTCVVCDERKNHTAEHIANFLSDRVPRIVVIHFACSCTCILASSFDVAKIICIKAVLFIVLSSGAR